MKALGALSAGFALMLGLAGAASAEPRVALVIGNSAYQGDLPALPNPANDAKLMAKTLKSIGFDVVEAEDASQDQMKKAIAEFSDKLAAAGKEGTGLFFYAGHGLQVAGENYLIPIDAKIKSERDVDLVSVSAGTVMKQMEFAESAVNIIILDACRNNPLGGDARSLSRGLAKIETARVAASSPIRPRRARPRRMAMARTALIRRPWQRPSPSRASPSPMCSRKCAPRCSPPPAMSRRPGIPPRSPAASISSRPIRRRRLR